jgi:hypothetical protein
MVRGRGQAFGPQLSRTMEVSIAGDLDCGMYVDVSLGEVNLQLSLLTETISFDNVLT